MTLLISLGADDLNLLKNGTWTICPALSTARVDYLCGGLLIIGYFNPKQMRYGCCSKIISPDKD